MTKIPFQRAQRSIPGSVPVARASADTFGAGTGRGLEAAGKGITTFAQGIIEKKGKETADLYVSKTTSEAGAAMTRRQVDLRRNVDDDIAATLDGELRAYKEQAVANAPNDEARIRTTQRLESMFGRMRGQAIIGDEKARTVRLETQSEKNHQNRNTQVYDNWNFMAQVMSDSDDEIDTFLMSAQDKRVLKQKRRDELGVNAMTGLIDSGREGAEQALQIMNDPHRSLNNIVPTGSVQKLKRYANQIIKSHDADADRAITRAEKLRVIEQRTVRNDLMDKHLDSINGTGPPITTQDLRASRADSGTKSFIMNMMKIQAQGDPPPPPDQRAEAYVDLVESIEAIEDPDNIEEIHSAIRWHAENRLISVGEMNSLVKRLEAPGNESRKLYEKSLKNLLTRSHPLTGVKDSKGDEQYLKAMQDIQDRISSGEIDERELFDPTSEHYIHKFMKQYVRPPLQIIADMANDLRGDGAGKPGSNEFKSTLDAVVKALDKK